LRTASIHSTLSKSGCFAKTNPYPRMAGGDMDDSFHDTYAEKPWNACSKHVNDRYEWRGAAVVFYEREGSKKDSNGPSGVSLATRDAVWPTVSRKCIILLISLLSSFFVILMKFACIFFIFQSNKKYIFDLRIKFSWNKYFRKIIFGFSIKRRGS
jgi:hypothetical protein